MGCKFQKRNALIVILVGSILAALICSECFILNTIVSGPLDAFSSTDWGPPEYFRKNMWNKPKPFLKIVAGVRGDLIEQGHNGLILINGVPFPNSAPLSHDRAGRPLRVFTLPVTLDSDEIWLLSDSPLDFDSRYLGAANIFKCHKAVPLLTF